MGHRRVFPVLLVIGLLLGQLAQLVHASDLEAHDGQLDCELCLLSHTHDQAGPGDNSVSLPAVTFDLVACVSADTPAYPRTTSHQPRAPPATPVS